MWIAVRILIVILTASFSVQAANSDVRLFNNGYVGVTVNVDPTLPSSQCSAVLAGIKTMFQDASTYLWTATLRRAYFSGVKIAVPAQCVDALDGRVELDDLASSAATADVRVRHAAHPVYGERPWTSRWSSECGAPGDFIQMSAGFVQLALDAAAVTSKAVGGGKQKSMQWALSRNAANDRHRQAEIAARLFVHEWAKFRWGVFEEGGFAADPLYPAYFRSEESGGEEWVPTGCTDGGHIDGSASPPGCSKELNECTFVPLSEQKSEITSSFMYSSLLTRARQFCNASSHVSTAPNRHNLLCDGRSVWSVMADSVDFKDGRNPPMPESESSPPPSGKKSAGSGNNRDGSVDLPSQRRVEFRVVQQRPPAAVYVLLENTDVTWPVWKAATASVNIFAAWHLPAGTAFGVATFGDAFRQLRPPQTVDAADRPAVLFSSIFDGVNERSKRWTPAVDGLLSAVSPQMLDGASVIMLTGSSEPVDNSSLHQASANDVQDMIVKLKSRNVRLHVVTLSGETGALRRVAAASGGQALRVPASRRSLAASVSRLTASFERLTHASDGSVKTRLGATVAQRRFVAGSRRLQGSFVVDELAASNGGVVTMLLLLERRDAFRQMLLRRPTDASYTAVNTTSVNDFEVVVQVAAEPGSWLYEVELFEPLEADAFLTAAIAQSSSPSPTAAQPIELKLWAAVMADSASGNQLISSLAADDVIQLNSANQKPLAVYASLMSGMLPVLAADLYVIVENMQLGLQTRIQLHDNGLTEPDLSSGDGVYSRYVDTRQLLSLFTSTLSNNQSVTLNASVAGLQSKRGELRLTAEAVSTPGCRLLNRLQLTDAGVAVGGSRLPLAGRQLTRPLTWMRRVAASPVTLRLMRQDSDSADVQPPTRVTDLRARVNDTQRTVTFTWTSPEDGVNGKVARYEVRYAASAARLRRHFAACTSVPHWTQPISGGVLSRATIESVVLDRVQYYAVRGWDAAGNAARLSNIVSVLVRSSGGDFAAYGENSSTDPSDESTHALSAGVVGTRRPAVLAAVCVALLVAAAVVTVLLVRCVRRTDGRNGDVVRSKTVGELPDACGKTAAATTTAATPSYAVTVKTAPEKSMRQPTTDFSLPVMWSASDILRSPSDNYGYQPAAAAAAQRSYLDGEVPTVYGVYGELTDGSMRQSTHPANAAAVAAAANTYRTPYIDDMMAYDSAASQPTESTGSHTSEPTHGSPYGSERLQSPAAAATTYDCYAPATARNAAPATLPKPTGLFAPAASTSVSAALPDPSLSRSWDALSERRRRNVTQV